MAVLKSKRKESQFQVFHNAYVLRKQMTDLLLRDFGYKGKTNLHETEKQLERRLAFEQWFIADERKYIIDLLRELITNITMANNIYPTLEYEYIERRLYQDKAIGVCNAILQELQYAIETLPVNVNNYIRFADILQEEIRLLKGWRKSDNRFRKNFE